MQEVLTDKSTIVCSHAGIGKIQNKPSQKWVKIDGKSMLVKPDPVRWSIKNCPNVGTAQTPCTLTLENTAGYSTFIKVGGQPICLRAVTGITNGLPASTYSVANPNQQWIKASG